MTILSSTLVAWLSVSIVMSALWYVQLKRNNAGIVDIAWSFGTGISAIWFCTQMTGDVSRRLAVGLIAGIWCLRLGFYLAKRVLSEREDGRYQMLREKWGEKTQPLMFGFFQLQAIWAVLFATPMLAAASNQNPFPSWCDLAGILVFAIAFVGEALSDFQLARFKSNPQNHGKVCKSGLWAWSRHPNYFFEWIHWFAYIFLAWNSPLLWVAVAGNLVMLWFITKVTGIKMTEARAVQSKGQEYIDYQRTTSAFLLLPPKRGRNA